MNEELQKQIDEKLSTDDKNDKKFSVFDFDNTCAVNDVAEATLNYMTRNDLFKDRSILPGLKDLSAREVSEKIFNHYYDLLGKYDAKGAYEFGAKTLSGFKNSEIEKLMQDVFAFEGDEPVADEIFGRKIAKGLVARPIILDLITYLQKRGVIVWIVSASPALLIAEAMKYFGIKSELIGVKNIVKDGVMTAELETPMPVVEGKVACIKKFINEKIKPILGAGDSMNDLPMLEYSDIKVVVNRANALSEIAKSSGWTLLDA
jgi:HAD superfamily phosphoserine phosphatase-like hydrolase